MDKSADNSKYVSGNVIPPPPSEIGVRTMASDIASIAQSGGRSPKPIPVRVSSRSHEIAKAETATMPAASAASLTSSPLSAPSNQTVRKPLISKPVFLYSLLAAVLAGAFFGAYFFAYPLLNPKQQVVKPPIIPVPPPTQTITFEHKSFFGQAIDGTFILEILSPVNGLEFEHDKISSFVSGAPGTFFEITTQSGGGQPFSANDFFSSISGNILGSDFLNANFENDFTMFLYKDKNGLWPGYILQLGIGKSPIFLQKDVLQKMQSASAERANIFLASPGTPANFQFQNGLSSGQPVWFLNYPNGSSTVAFGWFFNKYLAISTSLDGLKQAVLHF